MCIGDHWSHQVGLGTPSVYLTHQIRHSQMLNDKTVKKNSTVLVNECVRWHQKVSFANGGLPVQQKKIYLLLLIKISTWKFSWCNVAGWKVHSGMLVKASPSWRMKNQLWVVSPPNQWPHSRFAMNDKEPRLPMVGKDGGGKYTSGKWDSNNTVQVWRLRHHS